MSARLLWALTMCACLLGAPAAAFGRSPHPAAPVSRPASPVDAIVAANDASRQRPSPARFERARQIYSFEPGAIYELYANPAYVSTRRAGWSREQKATTKDAPSCW
jgi:type IV secretory pathway VirB9-like protein